MATVSAPIRSLLRVRAIPACFPRRCASTGPKISGSTPPTSRAPSTPKINDRTAQSTSSPSVSQQPTRQPVKPPALNVPLLSSIAPQMKELSPQLARKQMYAQKLYAKGQTMIYRPPSHVGMYAASWLMGGSAILIAGSLAYLNLWAYGTTTDLHWIVPVAHRLGIIAMTTLGGLIIARSIRFIRSIDLVPVNGLVKMAVQVRRPLPFLPPKEYLIAPYHFQMDRQFVQQMELPEFMLEDEATPGSTASLSRGLLSNIGRAISKGIYYPFASTRRIMTLEGFMSVNFEGVNGKMKLDTQGRFSNGAKDLIEMGSIRL